MANSQDIQDIISESSKKSLLDAQKNAEGLNKVLQDTILYAKQANDNLSGAKSMADFDKKAKAAELAQERINLATARTQKAQEQLIAVELSNQQKRDAYEKKQLEADAKRITSIEKKRKAIVSNSQAEIDAYNKSIKAEGNFIAIAQKSAKAEALAASQAVALSGKRKVAQSQLTEVISKQVEVVEDVGKRSGNIFQKIFSQVRNLAYILPGIGIAGIFGLALDPLINLIGKIDIFTEKIDALKEKRKQIEKTINEGIKAGQSEVTILNLGIESIKKLNIPLERRKQIYKEQQDLYPAYLQNFTFEEALAGKADKAYENLTKSIIATAKARAFADKIVENTNRQLDNESLASNLNVEIMLLQEQKKRQDKRSVDDIKNSTREAAGIGSLTKANDLQGKINDKIKERNNLLTDSKLLDQQNNELGRRAQAEQVEISDPKLDKVKKAKDNYKELEKDARDSAAALVQIEIDANKQIAEVSKSQTDNQNFSQETRLNSLQNFTATQIEIARLEGEKEKAAKKLNAGELLKVDADYQKKLQDANKVSSEKTLDILKYTAEEAERIRIIQGQNALTNIERQRDEEITKLISAYQKTGDYSAKAQEKLEKDRLAIVNKYALEEVNLQIQQAQKLIDIRKATGADVTKEQADLSALILKAKTLEVNEANRLSDIRLDKEKQNAQALKEVAQEVFDFSRSLTAQIFEGNISNLEDEKEARQRNTDLQIENVNESVKSEQEKSEQIAIINAQNEQQQAAIDAKIAEQKRKQAIADKAFALAQIVINTSVAVSKALAQTGVLGAFVIPGIIALGAIQTAAVLAQPIPKFKDGKSKSNNYEGFAYVGDGGQSELVINKDGSSWVTPVTSTLTYVGRDTEVISGPELARMRMMAKPDAQEVSGTYVDVRGIISSQESTARRMEKAVGKLVGKQKRNNRAFDMQSWNAHLKRNGL